MDDQIKERAQRIAERYAAKLAAGVGSPRRDGNFENQAKRYALGVVRTTQVRAETGMVLDGAGVPTIVRPFYYSFALRLDKLCRQDLGEGTLWAEGHILVSTWIVRGLKREVLLAIARDLFNLILDRSDPPACRADTSCLESIKG